MSSLPLVSADHPLLHTPTSRIPEVTPEVREFLEQMVGAMDENGGVGLAANQVGNKRRLAVIRVEERLYKLVNLEIIKEQGELVELEGCLSVPGWTGAVERAQLVVAKAWNEFGKPCRVRGEGLLARALLHEADHLDGRLYTEKLIPGTLRRANHPI